MRSLRLWLRCPLGFILALEALLFGAWLAIPFNSFASTPTLKVMSDWAPEWAWGLLFVAVSLLQFVALWSDRARAIIGTAAAAAILWLAVSVSFWWGNPLATASVTYPLFVVANLLLMGQSRADTLT